MRSKRFGGQAVPAFPTDKWWLLTHKWNNRKTWRPQGPFKHFKIPSLGPPFKNPVLTYRSFSKPAHYGQKRGRGLFEIRK